MSQVSHFMAHPKVLQSYFAPTYPQIRDIFFPTIEEVAHFFGLSVDIMEGNKEVHFRSGPWYYGTTICRSMEKPGTIVGFKVGRAMVDEVDTIPTLDKQIVVWRKIIARLRWNDPDVRNGADVVTTPEGFKIAHKLFVADIAKNPKLAGNYGLYRASTYDNAHNLPPDYIPSLFETYPEELIRAYIKGKFTNLQAGTVYNSFNHEVHSSVEIVKEKEPLYIGMDFNVTKMAARIFVKRGAGEWHCAEEIVDAYDTPDIIEIIKERYGRRAIYVYPDASGDSRHSTDASKSDIYMLEEAGFRVMVRSTNPRVKDRVMSVNKQFERGKLFVNTEQCPVTTEDLEQQAYDKNGEPDKSGGRDHGNDAFGYPIAYEFPIVKPLTQVGFSFHG